MLVALTTAAADTIRREHPLSDNTSLILDIPTGWDEDVNYDDEAPILIFKSKNNFQMQIIPLVVTEDKVVDNEKLLKGMLEHRWKDYNNKSFDGDLSIKEFQWKNGTGYYFSVSRTYSPSVDAYVDSVMMKYKSTIISATLLSDDADSKDVDLAFSMLKNIDIAERGEKDSHIKLTTNGATWSLYFPAENMKLVQERHPYTGQHDYYRYTSPRLTASFFFEPADKGTSSTDYRENFINETPWVKNPENVKRYDLNGFSNIEFILHPLEDKPDVEQINVSGHLVKDGCWVDMHLSKLPYKQGDEDILTDFINTISVK